MNPISSFFGQKEDNYPIGLGTPNPSSVYCGSHGGTSTTRTFGPDGKMVVGSQVLTGNPGDQVGVCMFADGTECEEWAFYNGTCSHGDPNLGKEISGAIVKTTAGLVVLGLGAIAGTGAIVGLASAAAFAGNKEPQYGKGALIGAGAGLAVAMVASVL